MIRTKKPDWTQLITDLDEFFTGRDMPKEVQLDKCQRIVDTKKFYEATMATVKANKNKELFKPYLDRLMKLKSILVANKFVS